jgi:hypothetical protein
MQALCSVIHSQPRTVCLMQDWSKEVRQLYRKIRLYGRHTVDICLASKIPHAFNVVVPPARDAHIANCSVSFVVAH